MEAGILLITAFVSAGIGYLAGLFLTRKGAADADADAPQEPGVTNGPRHEAHKLHVTLWSKTPQGPLAADLYGKTFVNREDVGEAEKNRLIQEIRTIEAWFGISTAKSIIVNGTPLSAAVPPKQAPERVVEPPAAVAVVPAPQAVEFPPVPEPDAEVLLEEMDAPPPIAPVPARLDNRSKIKPPEPKSIVQQINDILQEKVAASDHPETSIKLQETPQGVLVWIGNQSFQGIDSVPDCPGKEMIRAAVKEWEKR